MSSDRINKRKREQNRQRDIRPRSSDLSTFGLTEGEKENEEEERERRREKMFAFQILSIARPRFRYSKIIHKYNPYKKAGEKYILRLDIPRKSIRDNREEILQSLCYSRIHWKDFFKYYM